MKNPKAAPAQATYDFDNLTDAADWTADVKLAYMKAMKIPVNKVDVAVNLKGGKTAVGWSDKAGAGHTYSKEMPWLAL
jgi:beta-glucanase (GH16 family)